MSELGAVETAARAIYEGAYTGKKVPEWPEVPDFDAVGHYRRLAETALSSLTPAHHAALAFTREQIQAMQAWLEDADEYAVLMDVYSLLDAALSLQTKEER